MPVIFLYLVKLSLSLVVVYLFYRFVLQRLTFYNWNRFYLVAYTVLSFFIPFINITPVLERNEMASNKALQFIPSVTTLGNANSEMSLHASNAISFSLWDWALLLFGAGVLVMLTRMLIQLFSFRKIVNKAILISNDNVKLYQVNQSIIPFSFGNSIFINKQQHNEQELGEIIRHEFVHIRQKHTVDIVWSELLCILNWYNPFVWLIRKSIRQNLEFIADDKVLQSGIDKKQYQYLLLKVTGNNHFSIASQFNFSSLKKRIAMMNKMKTAKVQLLTFLFILPLLAVVLVAFRGSSRIRMESKINYKVKAPVEIDVANVKISNAKADTVPEWNPKPTASEIDFLKRHPKIKNITWGYIQSTSGIADKQVYGAAGDMIMMIYFTNGKTDMYNISSNKGVERFKKNYGEAPPDAPARPIGGEASTISRTEIKNPFTKHDQPLIILDDEIQKEDVDLNKLIAPADIDNMKVYKPETAMALYGDKARNGAIVLTSKSYIGAIVSESVSAVEVVGKPTIATTSNDVIVEGKPISKVGTTTTEKEVIGKPSAVVVEGKPVRIEDAASVSTTVTEPKPVQATTEPKSSSVNKTLAVIKPNTSEIELRKLENNLKASGYNLKITKTEYKNGRLISVSGTINKIDTRGQAFVASDFSKLIITEAPDADNNLFTFLVQSGNLKVFDAN